MRLLTSAIMAITVLTTTAALADDYQLSPPRVVATGPTGPAIVPALECDSCGPLESRDFGPRREASSSPSRQPLACVMAEMPLGPTLPGCTSPPLDLTTVPPR
jgi:hypothetical protein